MFSLFRFWGNFPRYSWTGPGPDLLSTIAFVMQPYSLFETGWWDLAYWSGWVLGVSQRTLTRMPRVTPSLCGCEDVVAGSEVWVRGRESAAACASGKKEGAGVEERSDRGIITPHPRLHPTLLPFPSSPPSLFSRDHTSPVPSSCIPRFTTE